MIGYAMMPMTMAMNHDDGDGNNDDGDDDDGDDDYMLIADAQEWLSSGLSAMHI